MNTTSPTTHLIDPAFLRQLFPKDEAGYDMVSLAFYFTAYPAEDWAWSMIFHSGRIASEAATYEIVGVGDSTQTFGYSNLFLFVPVTWFYENPGEHPIALYLRWSAMLQARHGTAGFGLVPPEDTKKREKTFGLASAFAGQFPGIELADNLGNQNVFWGLLSANWLNMIDTACVEQLGGLESIRGQLAAEPRGAAAVCIPSKAA